MKKSTKIVKKLLALYLVVLMSINTLAAVVSDNDGSAFITKAEFDNLKNNFQSQIDQYNVSIDAKIDGAIAAYLAGIIVNKYKKIKVLLNDRGVYGSNVLKWNSNTAYAWDSMAEKKANIVYDISDFDWDYANNISSRTWAENVPYYSGYLRGHAEHVGVSSIDDVTYITSKRVKKILSDRSELYCYERKRMYTSIYLNMTQWTPYRNAAATVTSPGYWNMGGPVTVISQNITNMVQDKINLYVDTFDLGNRTTSYATAPKWGYAFTGTVSLASTELDNTWDYELLCPISVGNDYYWDPNDKTTHINYFSSADTPMDTRYTTPIFMSGTSASQWHLNSDMNSVVFTPKTYQKFRVPWCEKSITHNEMFLKSLIDVHEKNKKIKNGIILYEVEEKGTPIITVNADYVGEVFFYVSKTPTDTWSEATVQAFDITAVNTDTKCTLNELEDSDNGKFIWMIYLPTDTTVEAVCKIADAQLLEAG